MRTVLTASAVIALFVWTTQAQTGHLYGIADGGDFGAIYEIDPLTGAATLVVELQAEMGLLGGLTALDGVLYATGVRNYPGAPANQPTLGRIDLATGAVTFVSDLGGRFNVQGLASNDSQGIFYGIDVSESQLLTITTAGVITPVGATGGVDGRGLAYDDGAGVLYALDLSDNLYTVDTLTGAGTLVGEIDISPTGLDQTGLAFDEFSRTLYLNDAVGDNLWIIDTATGAATLVGSNGVNGITGLAWVPTPGTLTLCAPLGALLVRRRR